MTTIRVPADHPFLSSRICGVTEIAEFFHVTQQTASRMMQAVSSPAPYQVLACGRVWLVGDVVRWAGENGRLEVFKP